MAERIKIEKDVPVPRPRNKFKEYLDKLEVGESFRVTLDQWPALRNAAGNANKKTNKKFTVKKVQEQPSKGRKKIDYARVWRTE